MSISQSITTFPKKTFTYFRQAREELKKVTWPSRETTVRYTGIVVVSSVVVGLLMGAIDYILALVLESVLTI